MSIGSRFHSCGNEMKICISILYIFHISCNSEVIIRVLFLYEFRQKKFKSSDDDDDGGISQKDLLELIEDVNFDSKCDDVSSNVFEHLNDRFKTTPSLRKASTGDDNEVVDLLKVRTPTSRTSMLATWHIKKFLEVNAVSI